MYKRVACSLRENPSRVQPYQAGLDCQEEDPENARVRKVKKPARRRELRWTRTTSHNFLSWNQDQAVESCWPALFEGQLPDSPKDNQMQPLLSTSHHEWTQFKLPVYSYGTLVWAKFSKSWFPAIVVDGFLAKVNPPKNGNLWVYWFGDHKVSEVAKSSLDLLTNRFRQRSEGRLSVKFETAMEEALKVCVERAELEDLQTYNTIREWGRSETGFVALAKDQPELFLPDQDCPYPVEVFSALRKIAGLHDSGLSDSDSEPESMTVERGPLGDTPGEGGSVPDRVGETARSKPLEPIDIEGEFCLSCARHRQIVSHHPLFEGFMCAQCRDSVRETFFVLDSDGHYLFCGICGEGGQLVMCETPDCGRSYCMSCLKKYIDYTAIKKLKSARSWPCFLCMPYNVMTHGLLVPRKDWQEYVIRLFNERNSDVTNMDSLLSVEAGPKRRLRVLSLFDGICTVKYVLEQLGLDIDVYFASEINETAELVTVFNHGFSVSQLGDVMKIERSTLQEIGPIDLLVGSPPCDDLDISNRDYEGFNGTGVFMFKFLLILKDLENINNGRPVHWLLETSANLKTEYRKVLSTFFEGPPALWDAKNFTAYLYPRYYWGNLPNMYNMMDHWRKLQIFMGTVDNLLDDFLITNLNRKAKMSKLRPVSIDACPDTRNETLARMDSEEVVDYQLPVLMDGELSEIWVNEVEKVLGFPEHYTDVSHLSRTQRQKLLKQASCVQVLKHLLSPLNKLFVTK